MDIVKQEKKNVTPYTVVSLFSGAGGLDLGFEKQGFKVIWANDINKDACDTHRLWSKAEVVEGDIGAIDFETIPPSDVITGGFPCQGFSLAGPRKIDDKRNVLYKHFVDLVEKKQPYIFVAENVKGILTLGQGKIMEAIVEDFATRGIGYEVFPTLVNAADYGVPQDRYRVILLGIRKDLEIKKYKFPEPFDYKVTLREALKDIEEPTSSDICQGAFSSRYMSRNRKREWNEVSYTIPAMSKQVTLHPSSPNMEKIGKDMWSFGNNGETRRFSWQEAAAIQTFPKNMVFVGDLTSKYKQIGNAVPVKLAEVIAEDVKKILDISSNLKLPLQQNKKQSSVSKQTEKGKAFEYACLKALENWLDDNQVIWKENSNKALNTAQKFYCDLDDDLREKMQQASKTAIKMLERLEPQLMDKEITDPIILRIQEDAKGIAGDVRDIVCERKSKNWEIGFSCKHNNTAVKHSRLSKRIDFGKQWFAKACSDDYFNEIEPIFSDLEAYRLLGKKWNEIDSKEDNVYVPLLNAFMKELKRLICIYKDEIPKSLVCYLLGKNDFYKIITQDGKKQSILQGYNLYGTLNKSTKSIKPTNKVHLLKLPSKIYDISFKEKSKNTIIVTCDGGWALSFRIHNASSKVEPSLKFDIQLTGIPQALHSQIEPWE